MDEKYSILGTTLKGIADAIRRKTGKTGGLVPENMEAEIDSVKTFDDLPALSNPASAGNIDTGYEVIDSSGNVLTGTSTKVQLPSISNPAGASQILNGYEAVNGAGQKVTGTYSLPTLSKPAGTGNIDSGYEVIDSLGNILTGTSTKVQLPTLANHASPTEILEGYEAISQDGGKITGTLVPAVCGYVETTGSHAAVTIPDLIGKKVFLLAHHPDPDGSLAKEASGTYAPIISLYYDNGTIISDYISSSKNFEIGNTHFDISELNTTGTIKVNTTWSHRFKKGRYWYMGY